MGSLRPLADPCNKVAHTLIPWLVNISAILTNSANGLPLAIVQHRPATRLCTQRSSGAIIPASGLEVGGNAGCAKDVAAELDLEAGIGRAPTHHAIGVDPVHWVLGQHAGLADRGAEEGGLADLPDASRGQIFVDERFELMVRRHLMALAAFLVQPHPPALAGGV